MAPLEHAYTLPVNPKGDVIVMLGGGATYGTPGANGGGNLTGDGANRLLTTATLYRKTKLPILLSSGPMTDGTSQSLIAKRQLIGLGVPANAIITENYSLNTEQNAAFSKPILQRFGYHHPILVTSAYHMERAVLDFQRVGITVIPYPCGYYVNRAWWTYGTLFPSAAAFAQAQTALHEYLGILAVRLHVSG